MTDPPMVGDVALIVARRYRVPLVVISEDVFPEIAVQLKRLENPVLVTLLERVTRFYLRRADRVVAIGETMEQRLLRERDGARADARDPELGRHRGAPAAAARQRAGRVENGLVGQVRGHALGQRRARAGSRQPDPRDHASFATSTDLRAVIVGFGARHADHVALAERLEADAVTFLPYQPRELLPQSLSSADVHFVGLGHGLSGFVVPSRLYGILAVGRPVIVAADADSETARLVREVGCGLVVPPGTPGPARRGRSASSSPASTTSRRWARRGRRYVEAEADREVALGRYRELLARSRRHDRSWPSSSGSRSPRSPGRTSLYPLAAGSLARLVAAPRRRRRTRRPRSP